MRALCVLCLAACAWFVCIASSYVRGSHLLRRCERRTAKLERARRERAAARAAKAAEAAQWGPPPGDPRYRNWSAWWPLLWPAQERRRRRACAPCGTDEAAFLIPSFPTSGSDYVKTFFSRATGFGQGEVYGPQEGFALLRLYGAFGEEFASFYYNVDHPAPIGVATLLKTHYPAIVEEGQEAEDVFGGDRLVDYFHGVVLLARNPIDAIVGQKTRWACHAKVYRESAGAAAMWGGFGKRDLTRNESDFWARAYRAELDACRAAAVAKLCDAPEAFAREVRDWNAFYDYWVTRTDASDAPTLVLRYEEMVAAPCETFRRLAAFMNVSVDEARLAAACDAQLRRHPAAAAQHGARLRGVCETTLTQEILLDATRRAAAMLGYAHDGDRATIARGAGDGVASTFLDNDSGRLDARVRVAEAALRVKESVKAAERHRAADERSRKHREKRRRHHHPVLYHLGWFSDD